MIGHSDINHSPFTSHHVLSFSYECTRPGYMLCLNGSLRRTPCTLPKRYGSNVPQLVDLLDMYRSLVASNRVTYDENQVRVVMKVSVCSSSRQIPPLMRIGKLRRLTKSLQEYAPPALSSHLPGGEDHSNLEPWWQIHEHLDGNSTSIVPFKGHAESIMSLTTPKVIYLAV